MISLQSDTPPKRRLCYAAVHHRVSNTFVPMRASVLLRSGSGAKPQEEKPYVAKVTAFYEADGQKMMALLWYYRPEHMACAPSMRVRQVSCMSWKKRLISDPAFLLPELKSQRKSKSNHYPLKITACQPTRSSSLLWVGR